MSTEKGSALRHVKPRKGPVFKATLCPPSKVPKCPPQSYLDFAKAYEVAGHIHIYIYTSIQRQSPRLDVVILLSVIYIYISLLDAPTWIPVGCLDFEQELSHLLPKQRL